MNIDRLASRKFMIAAFAISVSAVMAFTGTIDQETWSSLAKWILGLYLSGNVGEVIARGNEISITKRNQQRE